MPPGPEEHAREVIDRRLEAAGWTVRSFDELNLALQICNSPLQKMPRSQKCHSLWHNYNQLFLNWL